ncbi:MAG: MBL fold metallo-hydrolase [Thermoanaerobacteraceae bacterium]|nr:MBL fold metallo-hydrolase [Thermoanaerobacteraceae bacterium]
MEIIVLGNRGPYPGVDLPCSGYLVKGPQGWIVLDLGSGSLINLQKIIELKNISAIILSHLHSDHISDVLPLRYAFDIKMMKGEMGAKSVPVYLPRRPEKEFQLLPFKNVFELIPVDEGKIYDICGLEVEFKHMVHSYESNAIRFKEGVRTFVYSGDTAANRGLSEFAKNADLLLCESALLKEEKKEGAMHMTPEEAALTAKEAVAKRLLLTHFLPDMDPVLYLNEASSLFKDVECAEILKKYIV